MIRDASACGDAELADAFAVARGFLFRVQSEMVPLCVSPYQLGTHSGIEFRKSRVCVTLARRKNAPQRTYLERDCTCKLQGDALCAYHSLRRAVTRAQAAGRSRVFSFSYASFASATKYYAARAGVMHVGTHAFRRGMAQDMAAQGCPLYEILQAGGWKSAGFMAYMSQHELEAGACAQFVANHSDSETEL